MDDRNRFQLHMPGLLKVLAEHLYSSRRVGLRELLQNAHDSCVRRSIERPEAGYRPRINVAFDAPARKLRIDDNGSGLNVDEIRDYLATIGRGYTRELRERLSFEDPEAARELVGQFGLGFLSAFLLASEVVVETRSCKGGPPLRWHSAGDEHYDLADGSRVEPGTTVELSLKPAALFLLNERNIVDAVRAYADFLPTPIHVQGDVAPANLGRPPWSEPDSLEACRQYVERRFGVADPLWILPLHDGSVDIGHDRITVPLQGFLYVPPESVVSIREYGDVAVFIRRMAICESDRDLLPTWARFVRGVIDSPFLQPTASRESVHQDESYEAVQQAIADQLNDGLKRLADREPVVWRRIVFGHSDVIMGWAVRDGEFFQRVADSILLRTSRGRLTLPEYLKLSNGVVYYMTRELGSLQEKLLAEGRDAPAVDASWFATPAFLERYAKLHPEVGLVQLDEDAESMLRPAPPGELASLLPLCEELGFRTRVSSFKPAELPAIMIYPKNAETVRSAAAALRDDLIPQGFSGLVANFVEQEKAKSADVGTLHLNASSPLIRQLAASDLDVARRQAALSVVAHFAKLFCGRMLDAREAAAGLDAWSKSLQKLVQH